MFLINYIQKRILIIFAGTILLGFMNSCGIYQPSDARKVSPNADERVKKNLEEGKYNILLLIDEFLLNAN